MWRGKSISVVFPTYNERDSIRSAVLDFFASGLVDEIVVVNNNAAPGTDEEVAETGALLVHESQQGYGYAIRRGLQEAKGEGIIIAEPDGTFLGRDVVKLLAYSNDCDVVYGTRTHREFIWDGSNMGWLLKWGNYFVAKLAEFLFNSSTLSDVGCTMRYLSRPALVELEPHFQTGGSSFGLEMLLLSLMLRQRIVQVPVNYQKRVGISSVTGDRLKAIGLGLEMIAMICRYRYRSWFGQPLQVARPVRRAGPDE